MDFWMIRTFDHAGYYETRLILMAISLVVACYFAYYKPDRRFLLMFASGAVLQTILEYVVLFDGLRVGAPTVWVFGARMPPLLGPAIRGFTQGGPLAVFAFWLPHLRSFHASF